MISWFEVFVIAFTAQLAVLPGEKGQLIIAGLSTRFNPWIVVAAAATAFGGWTVLEILLGNALKGVLPEIALELFTGGLFFLFAVLLYRSIPPSAGAPSEDPESLDGLDVTVFGYDVPNYFGGFLPIFLLMAAGEFGDKTQLVTIGLAAQYGASSAIWFGEMAAIIPVSMLNAFFFHRFAHHIDLRVAHQVGAGLFAFFGADTFLSVFFDVSLWESFTSWVSQMILAFV